LNRKCKGRHRNEKTLVLWPGLSPCGRSGKKPIKGKKRFFTGQFFSGRGKTYQLRQEGQNQLSKRKKLGQTQVDWNKGTWPGKKGGHVR